MNNHMNHEEWNVTYLHIKFGIMIFMCLRVIPHIDRIFVTGQQLSFQGSQYPFFKPPPIFPHLFEQTRYELLISAVSVIYI